MYIVTIPANKDKIEPQHMELLKKKRYMFHMIQAPDYRQMANQITDNASVQKVTVLYCTIESQ